MTSWSRPTASTPGSGGPGPPDPSALTRFLQMRAKPRSHLEASRVGGDGVVRYRRGSADPIPRPVHRFRHRPRRDAAVDERRQPVPRRGAGRRDHPRRAGRRYHLHRHRRHLRAELGPMGHNEPLVGKAVRSYGGNTDGRHRAPRAASPGARARQWGRDGSLAYLRTAVEKSLRDLDVDVIDLYQWHRPDRWKVYGEVIGHFQTLQDEGKIRAIGISNANVEEIEVASEVLGDGGLASVQNEFSPRHPRQLRRAPLLRRARRRLPAVEPARRHRRRRARGRRPVRGLRRDRRGARRQPAAGRARLGAVPGRPRHPDPRGAPAGVDHRLGRPPT